MSTIDLPTRSVPRSVTISAWAVPVMVVGQFAMLAIVPLVVLVVGTLRNPALSPLRWFTAALAAAYATPLALWIIGPEREQSLSKDMHPVFVVLIVVASAALLVRRYTLRNAR